MVKGLPQHGHVVRRYSQGSILTHIYQLWRQDKISLENVCGFSSSEKIEKGYREDRSWNFLYDIANAPAALGYPNVIYFLFVKVWKSRKLKRLTDWSDVIIVDRPWQMGAIKDITTNKPIIYSSHDVLAEVFEHVKEKPLGKRFHNWAVNIEEYAVEESDLVIAVSDRDRENLEEQYHPSTRIEVLQNGITIPNRETNCCIEEKENPVGVFVGGQHPPNVRAAKNLLDIAETLYEDVTFHIIGPVGSSINTELSNVKILGYVSDLDAELSKADFAINPITTGGGSNVKILEYFAHGLPVISTPFGVRGLDVTDREEVLIGDINEFSELIRNLLQDDDLRQNIATGGKSYVVDNHSWSQISNTLNGYIRELL